MIADGLPTELEAVSENLSTVAQTLVTEIADLSSLVLCVKTIDGTEVTEAHQERLLNVVRQLVLSARIVQFGLERLACLSETAAESDRMLFSKTMQMVDMCRFARAIPNEGPPPPPSTSQLAVLVEEAVADLQEVLRTRFPGETCPGD